MKRLRQISFIQMTSVLIIILWFGITAHIFGQEVNDTIDNVVDTILSGEEFTGALKEEDDLKIILIVENNDGMALDKSVIGSMISKDTKYTDLDNREYPIDYHNATRYVIGPSGYGLRKGQSYYENIYFLFNSFGFGISDRFTVSLGGEIASLILSSELPKFTPIFFVSPRFNFPLGDQKGAFSAGAIFLTIPKSDMEALGLAQAALTFGTRNSNFNIGFGAGMSSDDKSVLMINLAATQRLSRKLSFVTDNFMIKSGYVTSDIVYVLSSALRIHFSKPGYALNVGFWKPLEHINDFVVLPMISATIPLN